MRARPEGAPSTVAGAGTHSGSPVGAGQGGISTRWQGYENSLHVGASEPYIPSAEAVEFWVVVFLAACFNKEQTADVGKP